jgi:hypothetical protein
MLLLNIISVVCDLSIPSCPQNKKKNTLFTKYKNPSFTQIKILHQQNIKILYLQNISHKPRDITFNNDLQNC